MKRLSLVLVFLGFVALAEPVSACNGVAVYSAPTANFYYVPRQAPLLLPQQAPYMPYCEPQAIQAPQYYQPQPQYVPVQAPQYVPIQQPPSYGLAIVGHQQPFTLAYRRQAPLAFSQGYGHRQAFLIDRRGSALAISTPGVTIINNNRLFRRNQTIIVR